MEPRRRQGLPLVVKLGVLAACGLLVLIGIGVVVAVVDGATDSPKERGRAETRRFVDDAQTCAARNGDLFRRVGDPYWTSELDAGQQRLLARQFPPALRRLVHGEVVHREGSKPATAIFFALGDDADDRAGFMKGTRESAKASGVAVSEQRLGGTDVLVQRADGGAAIYGLVPCGGLAVVDEDAATSRRVWTMLAELA